jgi:predicted GIY-YIG superfamily endonuclease
MNNVYLIKRVDENKYKIGVTKNIVQRLQTLQTANPAPLEIIDLFSSMKWAYKIEADFKRTYRSKRTSGEWFELTEDEILNFQNFCESKEKLFDFMYEHNEFFKKDIDSGR